MIDANGNVRIVNDVKIVNAESGAIVIDSRNKLDGSPLDSSRRIQQRILTSPILCG